MAHLNWPVSFNAHTGYVEGVFDVRFVFVMTHVTENNEGEWRAGGDPPLLRRTAADWDIQEFKQVRWVYMYWRSQVLYEINWRE